MGHLPFYVDTDDSDAVERERNRRAIERESIMVRQLVTGVCEPLAKAFLEMPTTGLLYTRYHLYLETCDAIIKTRMIEFHQHTIDVPKLVTRVWRIAAGGLVDE